MVRAVLTVRSTGSGFDLAWFSCVSSELLCVCDIRGVMFIIFLLHSLPFSELSLVRLALDLVD